MRWNDYFANPYLEKKRSLERLLTLVTVEPILLDVHLDVFVEVGFLRESLIASKVMAPEWALTRVDS